MSIIVPLVKYLDFNTLLKCRLVSKQFNRVIYNYGLNYSDEIEIKTINQGRNLMKLFKNVKLVIIESPYESYYFNDKEIKDLVNLKKLGLSYTSKITDEGIKQLVKLETLYLWGNWEVNDNCKITDEGIKYLVNLKELCLWKNGIISDEGIKYLVNLTSIDLSENSKITDEGIKYLVNLNSINLMKNSKITTEMRNELRKNGVKIIE